MINIKYCKIKFYISYAKTDFSRKKIYCFVNIRGIIQENSEIKRQKYISILTLYCTKYHIWYLPKNI